MYVRNRMPVLKLQHATGILLKDFRCNVLGKIKFVKQRKLRHVLASRKEIRTEHEPVSSAN